MKGIEVGTTVAIIILITAPIWAVPVGIIQIINNSIIEPITKYRNRRKQED